MGRVNVVLTLGLADRLLRRIRAVDPRLAVKLLSPAQRRVYRGGRSVWYGYAEDKGTGRGEAEGEEGQAGGTPAYLERTVDIFCDNLRRYLSGEPLQNVVDVGRGY